MHCSSHTTATATNPTAAIYRHGIDCKCYGDMVWKRLIRTPCAASSCGVLLWRRLLMLMLVLLVKNSGAFLLSLCESRCWLLVLMFLMARQRLLQHTSLPDCRFSRYHILSVICGFNVLATISARQP